MGKASLPQKRFYRARAHSNPLSDCLFPVPVRPEDIDWSAHFPAFYPLNSNDTSADQASATAGQATVSGRESGSEQEFQQAVESSMQVDVSGGNVEGHQRSKVAAVRFADVGCGFGGLLVQLSPLFPDTLMLGFELRDKVSEYVKERILALRKQHPGQYRNISIERTNAMKYLPNYFRKGQLTKMFFLFPDPHFKEKNHRRRIISQALLAEYAYVLAVGGILYTITDVEELGGWMDRHLAACPLFEKLTEEELSNDPVVPLLSTSSEEALKVKRNGGSTYMAVYRRIASNDKACQLG